jgi:hypothetical protein
MLARLAVLGVAITALAAPAFALADTIGAVGVNDIRSDGILVPNAAWNGPTDLDMAAAAGVQLYRARIQLNCVDAGHAGIFNFSSPSASCGGVSYDALVGSLAARGMTLLPVLINFSGTTPQPPTADGAAGSPTIAEFAAFAAAAVGRYGPTGSFWPTCGCTPHPIEAWEIWNEENNGFWWDGNASAADYATVFAATRAALRSVDPQARAVVGGLVFGADGQSSFVPPVHMIQALTATNANAFDAVAIHPYTNASGASAAELANDALALVRRVAEQVTSSTGPAAGGAPRQQIWITEMGWSSESAAPATIAGGLQTFFALLDAGARAQYSVGPVLWYDLRDSNTLGTIDDALGLRLTTADGSDGGPKPVWSAFSAAAEQQATIQLPPALPDSGPYAAAPTTRAASGGVAVKPTRASAQARTRIKQATARRACKALKGHRRRHRACIRKVERRAAKKPAGGPVSKHR